MKFRNPILIFFEQMDKPKAICLLNFFRVGRIKITRCSASLAYSHLVPIHLIKSIIMNTMLVHL